MNAKSLTSLLMLVVLLAACGAMPKTADEFRATLKQNPNMMGVRVEHFDINRPMPQAARFVKKKTEECLKKTIRHKSKTSSGGMLTSYSDSLVSYKPVTEISATKATISMTENWTNLKGEPTQEPYFAFVMDIKPVSSNKSKADLYYTWGEPRPRIAKALTAWATGTDIGCPNLAAQ